jgi:hypothetical protein
MHSERGAVVVIFSIFMLAIIPLLALSVDTYFMAQGRMDEQNIAEYASLTTLDGYIVGSEAEVNIENAHAAGQTKSLLYLKSIEGDNKVTGLAANSGWNLTQNSCNGTVCAGTGWTLEYGTLDLLTGIFTQASDPGLINAVRFSMELPDNSFYSYLRTQVNKESGSSQQDNMKLPVSAIGYMEVDGVGDKYFRLYRNRASGVDGEDGPDGDDGPVVDSGNHTGGGAI